MSQRDETAADRLAQEVAETRRAVIRILNIMEADKIRSMKAWTAFGAAMVVFFVVWVVTHA